MIYCQDSGNLIEKPLKDKTTQLEMSIFVNPVNKIPDKSKFCITLMQTFCINSDIAILKGWVPQYK